MDKQLLMTPGPMMVPLSVRLVGAQEMIHHRTPAYCDLFKEVCEDLKYIFQTNNQVLMLTSSGTGAMEAAVCNLLSEGDTVIVVEGGKFGERWVELCTSYKVNTIKIEVEWGEAVKPEQIEAQIKKYPQCKAVFTTLCETSTAVKHPIKEIAQITNANDIVLVVDAISGLCADVMYMDDWHVDVVVAGSQKALMLPPGLAFIAMSERAWKLSENSKLPKYYFNLSKYKQMLATYQTPYTPAVSLVMSLHEILKQIKKKTLQAIWDNCERLANGLRAAVRALNLELFSKAPSNAVTAILLPPNVNGKALIEKFFVDYGIVVAEGQGWLSGKIFRVAHMGYVNEFDLLSTIAALERILFDMGYPLQIGSGLKAAENILLDF